MKRKPADPEAELLACFAALSAQSANDSKPLRRRFPQSVPVLWVYGVGHPNDLRRTDVVRQAIDNGVPCRIVAETSRSRKLWNRLVAAKQSIDSVVRLHSERHERRLMQDLADV